MSGKENQAEVKYIVNSDYVLREIAGEFMLIPTGKLSMTTNGVVTISDSAAFLWKKMDEGKTLSQLSELVLEEYDVDRETALTDVKDLIRNMRRLEMIRTVP